jgi:hypothetical protein
LEGSVNTHVLSTEDWAGQVASLTRATGATFLDWVVAVPAAKIDLLSELEHKPGIGQEGLAGVCVAVTDAAETVDAHMFDAVITARGDVSAQAERVFRMLSSMSASYTITCVDGIDIVEILRCGHVAKLVDAFWSNEGGLCFPSPTDQMLFEQARGVVIVVHLSSDDPDPGFWKRIAAAVQKRKRDEAVMIIHAAVGQRADASSGPNRHIDMICSV